MREIAQFSSVWVAIVQRLGSEGKYFKCHISHLTSFQVTEAVWLRPSIEDNKRLTSMLWLSVSLGRPRTPGAAITMVLLWSFYSNVYQQWMQIRIFHEASQMPRLQDSNFVGVGGLEQAPPTLHPWLTGNYWYSKALFKKKMDCDLLLLRT